MVSHALQQMAPFWSNTHTANGNRTNTHTRTSVHQKCPQPSTLCNRTLSLPRHISRDNGVLLRKGRVQINSYQRSMNSTRPSCYHGLLPVHESSPAVTRQHGAENSAVSPLTVPVYMLQQTFRDKCRDIIVTRVNAYKCHATEHQKKKYHYPPAYNVSAKSNVEGELSADASYPATILPRHTRTLIGEKSAIEE